MYLFALWIIIRIDIRLCIQIHRYRHGLAEWQVSWLVSFAAMLPDRLCHVSSVVHTLGNEIVLGELRPELVRPDFMQRQLSATTQQLNDRMSL